MPYVLCIVLSIVKLPQQLLRALHAFCVRERKGKKTRVGSRHVLRLEENPKEEKEVGREEP